MMAQEKPSVCLMVMIIYIYKIWDVTEVEVVLRRVSDFSKNNFIRKIHNYKQTMIMM